MGVSAQGKRETTVGENRLYSSRHFASCCFSRKVPLSARSLRELFGFKGNFLLVSVGFDWGPESEHQHGAEQPHKTRKFL